jgi:hypothetical protein
MVTPVSWLVHSTGFDKEQIYSLAHSLLSEDSEKLPDEFESDLREIVEMHRKTTIGVMGDILGANGIVVIETTKGSNPVILEELRKKDYPVDELLREGRILVTSKPMMKTHPSSFFKKLPEDAEFFLHGHFRNLCEVGSGERLRKYFPNADIHVLTGTASLPLMVNYINNEDVYDFHKIKKTNLIQFRDRLNELKK